MKKWSPFSVLLREELHHLGHPAPKQGKCREVVDEEYRHKILQASASVSRYQTEKKMVFNTSVDQSGVWSYRSHGVQCGVITSHSTCCSYCVRDYHISFRLFASSNPSVPTLCLKDPRTGVDTIQPDLLLTVR